MWNVLSTTKLSFKSLSRVAAITGLVMMTSSAVLAAPVTHTSGPNLGFASIGPNEYQLSATGGDGTYVWSLVPGFGTLPPGMAIRTDMPWWFPSSASAGLIGVATVPGTYHFRLRVSSGGQFADQDYTFTISTLVVKEYQVLDAYVGEPYSYVLTAQRNGADVSASWQATGGSYPSGVSLSPGGVLLGTPTTAGSYNFSYSVAQGGETIYKGALVVVNAIHIRTDTLPNARQGNPYTAAITATGGSGNYTFSYSGGLPPGILPTDPSGTISGIPVGGPGVYTPYVTVTDNVSHVSSSKWVSLDVVGVPPALPLIAPYGNAFWDVSVGMQFSQGVAVRYGGRAPFTWNVAGLPQGVSYRSAIGGTSSNIQPGDLEFWGVVTVAGTYNITFTVTDADGLTATNTFALHVSPLQLTNPLTNGTLGSPYSSTLRITGGTMPYDSAQIDGRLPQGLALTGSTQAVSGTPGESGNFNARFHFSDAAGNTLDQWNGLFIGGPAITINTYDNLGAVTVGTGYSNQLSACCATSINWSVVDPSTLPPGMGLSPGGVLSGTPTVIGTYIFTVQAADAANNTNFALHQFTLTITPMRVLTNYVLPFGNVGSQYGGSPAGFPLQVTGGTGPWTFTLMPGWYLPPGIGISLAGVLTGVPTSTGQYSFSVKIADAAGHSAQAYFSLSIYPAGSVPPPGFNFNTNLGTWSVGQVDGVQLTGTGGNGTYTFTYEGGTLPPGLAIRTDAPSYFPAGASGLIGVATTPGTYTFQLGVTSAGVKTVQRFTMRIANLVVKNLYSQPDTFVGQAFSFQLVALRDGQPVPATWTATSPLPTGVFLSASGELHGTPAASGFQNINFSVSDGVDTVFRSVSYTAFALDITTSGDVLPNATQNAFYSTPPLSTTGGSGSYSYSLVSGFTGGLTFNPSTGALSGTINAGTGTFSYTIFATDTVSGAQSDGKRFTINVVGAVPVLPLVTNFNTYISDCTIGVPCSRSYGVQGGGSAPFTWTQEGLPPGMDIQWGSGLTSTYLNPTQVEIWGTPVVSGTFNVTLTVTDALGVSASQTFPLVVSELLLTTFLSTGTIETPYSQGLRVIGGAPGYTATQTAGALANGLSLASASQIVSGTPHESGSFNTTILFTDTASRTIQNTFFYAINGVAGKIGITTASDLGFVATGSAFSRQLTASINGCCASGLTWTLFSGTLPPGISISAGGLLSGTPTVNGVYTFVIRATDSGNAAWFAGRQFTLNVTPLNISGSLALPFGNVGVPYSTTPVVTGGSGAITWTLSPANYLPPGLSVVGGNTIAGTPTSPGLFTFSMTASDSAGHIMLRNFSLSIYPRNSFPPINATSIGPNYGPFGVGVINSIQLAATGGAPPLHYSITPGAPVIPGMRIQEGLPLPTFFSLSVAAGYIGVVTAPGSYNTSIRVTDANGNIVDRPITLVVQPWPLLSQFSLPKATVGVPYSFTLSTDPWGARSNFGTPNFIAGWTATGLPPGLSVDGLGRITGTPTVSGSFSPQFASSLRSWSDSNANLIPDCDLSNFAANGECGPGNTNNPLRIGENLVVDPYAITTGGALPAGTVGTAYSQTLTAPGCGANCTFFVSGALPAGLTLTSAGVLSGTPGSVFAGTFTVLVNSSNGIVSKVFSLVIANPAQPLTISNGSSFGTTTVGSLVANGLFATGGTPPYTWSIVGGALPAGVTIQGPGLSTGCLIFESVTSTCSTPTILGAGATIGANLAPGAFYLAGRIRNVGQNNFTLQVTDSLGAATSKVFTWTGSPLNEQYFSLPVSIGSPSSVVMPLVYETAYTQPLLALGGTGSYTWTNTAPLPMGLALDPATGVVSGTPLSIGSFSVPIQATDTANAQFLTNVTFNITGPSLTPINFGLGSTSGGLLILNSVVLGGTSTYTFNPTGGTGPYTISALTPLPPGCALETGNAVLSGGGPYVLACVPPAGGTFNFALEIRDSSTPTANVGARAFQLTALPITLISPSVLAPATLNVPYSQSIIAFDNNGPVTWSAASPLPPGLSLSSAGVISGTPTGTAPSNFTGNATDIATGITVSFGFSISVSSLAITDPQVLPTQIVGAPISYTFNATGITAAPTWTANGLPAFLTLDSSTGLLRTTGTSNAGLFTFVVNLSSGAANTSRRFTLFIRQPNPTILDVPMTSTLLPDVAAGQVFVLTLAQTGGMPPYSWGVVAGSALPSGLNLIPTSLSGSPIPSGFTPATTLLAGVPTTPGRYAFDLNVTDNAGVSTQRRLTLNVTGLNILPGAPRSATTGVAYAEQFTAVGGTPPYTFTAAPQALGQDTFPPGFVLSPSGLLSGTTSSTGGYTFTLTVRDSAGLTFSRTYAAATTLVVSNSLGLRVTSTNPFDRPLGAGGGTQQSLTTSGASTYSWSITPGSSLPPGLSIQSGGTFLPANTTFVVGQATSAGVFTYSLRATDTANTANFADHTFTLKVPPQHLVSPPLRFLAQFVLSPGQVGVPYSFRFRMAGGTSPYTFSDLGTFGPLPPGLTLSADGVLSGTPQAIGNYAVGLFATDAAGNVGTVPAGFTLTVTTPGSPVPLLLSGNGNVNGPAQASVGVPYAQPLDIFLRGGQAPFTWSVASGSLPPGMTLVPGANGVSSALAGIPTAAGTFNFTVTVTDATGQSVPPSPAQLIVSPIVLKPGAVPPGVVGVPYSVSLVPSGGVGPYTLQLDPTLDLPPGLALSPSGVLSGTPTIARIFNVGVLVADAGSANTLYRIYRITIDDAAGEVPAVTLSPNPILINYLQGAPGGAAIPVTVATTSAPAHFSLVVGGVPGATAALDGFAPGITTLNLDAASVASGTYAGALGINVPDAANLYDFVPVVLNVAPAGSDRTPPVIGPVSDVSAEATSAAGAVVAFATPSVTDDFYPAATVSVVPASGSVFPIGVTLVTVTATDSSGNVSQKTFNVTVVDTTTPVLSLPANISAEATSAAGAVVNYSATALDVVDGPITPNCVPSSAATFAFGATTVNCSVTDAHGNPASGSFTVAVADTVAPSIAGAPGDRASEATSAAGAVVSWTPPTASDVVDGTVAVSCTPVSGTVFTIGATPGTCTAVDSHGNQTSSHFTITVQDTTPPVVAITSPTEGAVLSLYEYVTAAYTCADAVGLAACTAPVTNGDAIDTSTKGPHVFRVSAADISHLSSVVEVHYTVVAPPTITVTSPSEPIYERGSTLLAQYTCADAVTCVGDVDNGTALDTTTPGYKYLTITATDAVGNIASTVVVYGVSYGAPIAPITGLTAWLAGDGSAIDELSNTAGTWTGTPAYAPGKVGQAFSVSTGNTVSFPVVQSGPFTLQAWVKTSNPKQPYGSAVLSTGGPGQQPTSAQIELDGAGNYQLNAGNGDLVLFIGPAADSFHHVAVTYDGSIVTTYFDGQPVLGDVWLGSPELGILALNLGVDRGGSSPFGGLLDEVQVSKRALSADEIQQTFLAGASGFVKDHAPVAVITLASPSPAEATGPVGATMQFDGQGSNDADGDVLTYSWHEGSAVLGTGSQLSTSFPIGSHQITLTVDDGHFKTGSTDITVVVQDTTPPIISGTPASFALEATSTGGAVATWTSPTATDIVDGNVDVVCAPASGTTFAVGTTAVTCTATDAHSNAAHTSFDVTVSDTKPPVLTGVPAGITSEATGSGGAVVSWTPTATDVVDGGVSVTCVPSAGSLFAIGTTHVECSAVDTRGNRATAGFDVVVQDTTPPVFSGVPSILIREATTAAGATATWSAPTAVDLVDGSVSPTCTAASGSLFPIGESIVSCSAADSHGNHSEARFTVRVVDTVGPALSLPVSAGAEATGPLGAVVSYVVSATDAVSGAVAMSCAPASGSTFGVGLTAVTCSAADGSGNVTVGEFPVVVRDTTPPTGQVMTPSADAVLTGSPITVTVQASDIVGVASVVVNGTPASLSSGTSVSGTWTAAVPIAIAPDTAVELHAVVSDSAGNSIDSIRLIDNDGIQSQAPPAALAPFGLDRGRTSGDDLSNTFSSEFNNGITAGAITRNGWTATLSASPAPPRPVTVPPSGFWPATGWVQVGISGSPSPAAAIVGACVGRVKQIRLNVSGERGVFACDPTTGTIAFKALSALPMIEVWKQLNENVWLAIPVMTGGGISTGSPTTAFPDNPGPIDVKVIRFDDSGSPRTVGTFRLEPGATADVQVKADAAGRDDEFVFRALHGRVPMTMGNVVKTLEPGSSTTVPIDRMPPEIAVGVPRADAVYVLHQSVTGAFSCSDAGSGIASCDGSSESGQLIPTAAVGGSAFSVVAVDRAGNSQSVSIPYAVTYAVELAGDGAVDENGTLHLSLRLADALGMNQSAKSIPIRAAALVSVDGKTRVELVDELEFDARSAAYDLDVKAAGLPAGNYRLHVEVVGDPVPHTVLFPLKQVK